jgi:hypothetical protein
LKEKGYPEFSKNFISIGGGGHGVINKIIIGGEGCGFLKKRGVTDDYKLSISGGCGFFDIGYMIYSSDKLNIYPTLGLGGGGLNFKIVQRGVSPSFDDVLGDPKKGVFLSTTRGFLLKLGLGTEYLLKLWGEGGLSIGLRMGYTFGSFKDWDMCGIDISGGPKTGFTGPFISLVIGFWGDQKIEK